MSIKAYAWAKSIKAGSPTLKAVLCAIADYADDKGRAWPSLDRIAENTEFSARAVRMAVGELTELGLITRQERFRPDGGRSTDILTLQTHLLGPLERHSTPLAPPTTPVEPRACPPAPDAGASSRTCAPRTTNELPLNVSEANASGSADAAPHALSIKDRLWMDGPLAMVALGEKDHKARKMIGRWLRQTSGDAGRVLWAIEEAVRSGSGDPIAYVSRILAESPGGTSEAKKQGRANPYFEVAEQELERHHATGSDAHGFRPRLVASSGF